MITSVTWEIFLNIAFFIVLGYYAITSLLLYSGELKVWIIRTAKRSPSDSSEPISAPASNDIIGQVNRVDIAQWHTSTIVDKDIAINSKDETQEPIKPLRQGTAASADNLLVGSVADLLEEIKTLVQLIGEYKSSKAESQSFFHALFLRYPQLVGTTYQEAINMYLLDAARNQFSFDVSPQEIASWWATTKPSNN